MYKRSLLTVVVAGLVGPLFVGCASPLAGLDTPSAAGAVSGAGLAQTAAPSVSRVIPDDNEDHASWKQWNQPCYNCP